MSDSRNNFFDYNWKGFEQFFGGKVPMGNADASSEPMNWVESYVKDVMKQALPSVELHGLKHHFHTEVFDTHNNIIVKVHIPDRNQARQVRVFLSANQLRLEGLPNDAVQNLKLNSLVVTGSCKAVYKNGILQLHMRKASGEQPYYEVDVRYL